MINYVIIFNRIYVVEYGIAVDSKKFNEFLKDQGLKLYHTYSEAKVSRAEQMIRTYKNVNKLKHNMH